MERVTKEVNNTLPHIEELEPSKEKDKKVKFSLLTPQE